LITLHFGGLCRLELEEPLFPRPGTSGAIITSTRGWAYDKLHDAFTKDGPTVMVKVVWRALVEERGS
jgi:hypothetical protein